jgi:hypothetical protein
MSTPMTNKPTPERASPMFLGDGELIDSEEDSPWQE